MLKWLSKSRNLSIRIQIIISISAIIFSSLVCFLTSQYIGYKVVALLLMVVVSLLAMLLDIKPVLLAAVLSSLIWNFFFIPPLFTFHIESTEDGLMFLMYFLIALVNAVFSTKIRDYEKKNRDKEEKEKTIVLYNTILNSLSHELRTPISSIIASVDTLKENRERLSLNIQNNLLNEIELASSRLNIQVENLLNMSRLESGILKLKIDWCDLEELLYSIIQRMENIDSNRIKILIPEDMPLIKADALLIEQSIQNILRNALIYTPKDSQIEIKVEINKSYCNITIIDNGDGFPEESIPFVFDKFFRLPKTKTGGTGLGLSIAKGFIEAHGGKIFLENCKNGGAKFTISLNVELSYLKNLKNE